MAKKPQYIADGWRPNGPGRCICPMCRETVPTNALARASHAKACVRRKKAAADRYLIDCDGKPIPTYSVRYVPSGEYLSHHETAAEARAAKARYIEADNRRART